MILLVIKSFLQSSILSVTVSENGCSTFLYLIHNTNKKYDLIYYYKCRKGCNGFNFMKFIFMKVGIFTLMKSLIMYFQRKNTGI